ncbi:MAG TPA: hypothetical protein VF228_01165 [Iamia sp.]
MLFLLAAPSAADEIGTITGGTITVPLGGTAGTIVAALGGTTPCTPSVLSVTSTTATGGNLTLSIPQGAFDFGTPNPHVLVATAAGTYTNTPSGTTPPPTTPQNYTISGSVSTNATTNTARIFARTGDCTATSLQCGPIVTTITFTGTLNGTIDASGNIVGTATINGTGTLSAFGCVAPFTTINTKVLSINNMTVVFT